MDSEQDVRYIKGVGDVLAKKFNEAGIFTVRDLIYYFPRSYTDYSKVSEISNASPGLLTLKAKINNIKSRYSKRGLHLTEAVADDGSKLKIVWFNQPYRAKSINQGEDYYISGELKFSAGSFSITNPAIELAETININTNRIVPIYPLTKSLSQSNFRKALLNVLENIRIKEVLPGWIIEESKLISLDQTIKNIHFPESQQALSLAKQRLSFDEIFLMTLTSELIMNNNNQLNAPVCNFDEHASKKLIDGLGFKLTTDQKVSAWQIIKDLAKPHPMNRLLYGDVGSGKTVVAGVAALNCIKSGHQVALMAPTQLLARQHFETFSKVLSTNDIQPKLLTSASTNKSEIIKEINSGRIPCVIGTHALLSEKILFKNIGLLIIDEQHRFGVKQRENIQKLSTSNPHLLTLSATPIPRSLSLTLYGELSISKIMESPLNRKKVETEIIKENDHQKFYERLSVLAKTKQVFIVCPSIESSLIERGKSVKQLEQDLKSNKHYKGLKITALHGKMKDDAKQEIIEDFRNKKTDILIATTVIEVGIDIPSASIMVIESPELFGLAQIHQLRGRVGRSDLQSYCYLLSNSSNNHRLKALVSHHNGYELAQYDLKIRGPGEIYGKFQHGKFDLNYASLDDIELIKKCRAYSSKIVKSDDKLLKYPELLESVNQLRTITKLN